MCKTMYILFLLVVYFSKCYCVFNVDRNHEAEVIDEVVKVTFSEDSEYSVKYMTKVENKLTQLILDEEPQLDSFISNQEEVEKGTLKRRIRQAPYSNTYSQIPRPPTYPQYNQYNHTSISHLNYPYKTSNYSHSYPPSPPAPTGYQTPRNNLKNPTNNQRVTSQNPFYYNNYLSNSTNPGYNGVKNNGSNPNRYSVSTNHNNTNPWSQHNGYPGYPQSNMTQHNIYPGYPQSNMTQHYRYPVYPQSNRTGGSAHNQYYTTPKFLNLNSPNNWNPNNNKNSTLYNQGVQNNNNNYFPYYPTAKNMTSYIPGFHNPNANYSTILTTPNYPSNRTLSNIFGRWNQTNDQKTYYPSNPITHNNFSGYPKSPSPYTNDNNFYKQTNYITQPSQTPYFNNSGISTFGTWNQTSNNNQFYNYPSNSMTGYNSNNTYPYLTPTPAPNNFYPNNYNKEQNQNNFFYNPTPQNITYDPRQDPPHKFSY